MTKIIPVIARVILGLIYTVFGGMGLGIALGLMTMPEPQGMPEAAMKFMEGIMATSYFFPVLKATEALFGFLVLSGFFAPLALIVLAPVTFQIILYHAFLTPSVGQQILPLVMGLAHIIAMSGYWDYYRPLFSKK